MNKKIDIIISIFIIIITGICMIPVFIIIWPISIIWHSIRLAWVHARSIVKPLIGDNND